jgi:hypothetical protein
LRERMLNRVDRYGKLQAPKNGRRIMHKYGR